jgi:predicted small secreted protein
MTMNVQIKRILSAAFLAGSLAGALSGCNTVEGAGKDLEEAGEEIQEESQDHQDTD